MNQVINSKIDSVDFANLVFGRVFTDHMTVVKYADKQWGKAEIVPYGPLPLVPSIAGLHYGQAVFEGMKAFWAPNDTPIVFRPEAHAARINRSLERLDMPTIPEDLFITAIDQLIKQDHEWLKRAGQVYLRPFVFAASQYLGVGSADEYLFIVLACPVGGYYTKPLNLKVETEYSRSAPGGVGFAKAAGNYAASLYPTRLAKEAGFDQLIWTDATTHTKIEESGTMNIMAVIDGKLVTPALSPTILAGINRDSLLTLARDNNIVVEERELMVVELIQAFDQGIISELFGVGTAVTVVNAESVTFGGKKYVLPPLTDTAVSTSLFKQLDAIKRGKTADVHGWMRTVAI